MFFNLFFHKLGGLFVKFYLTLSNNVFIIRNSFIINDLRGGPAPARNSFSINDLQLLDSNKRNPRPVRARAVRVALTLGEPDQSRYQLLG